MSEQIQKEAASSPHKPGINALTPTATRLGDIVNFKRGYDLPETARRPGPHPVISSAGISGWHDEYKASGEGVVTGRYGTLGEMHYYNGHYWPHNTALYATDFKGNDPKYVYYLLTCLGRLNTGDKSTVPGVNRNDLHELVIPLITGKAAQKDIANVLSAIDAKIDLNNRINAELEALAKTIYDYWFVQFDFPDANGRPYKSSGGRMVWNKTLGREVPDGWGGETLWDVADYTNGLAMQKFRPTGGEYLPVIKIKEMSDGITPESERASPSIAEKYVVNDGDVLFSWSATLSILIWAHGRGALNQHIFKVTSEKYPRSHFYFQLVNYLDHFKMLAEKRKTTMGHITLDHLRQASVIKPPIGLVKKLDDALHPMFEERVGLSKQSQELARLRDWLLPLLMNGQVRVA